MSNEEKEIKLTVRLDDVIAPLHVGLKALLLLVDELLGRPPADAMAIPSVPRVFFSFDPAPAFNPSRAELRGYVEQRILHWAASDAIELVKPLIVSARAVCAIYDHGASSSITGDDWNAMLERSKRIDERMASLNLPNRLREFALKHPDFKMPPLLPEVQGIFKMRNCILHNNGIITGTYSNGPDGLRIRFWRWIAWVIDPAGDHEYREGEIVRFGQKLQVRFDRAERMWSVGERIVLSHQLFVDLCVTIDRFAIQMAQALEEYARLRGIPFESNGGEQTNEEGSKRAV